MSVSARIRPSRPAAMGTEGMVASPHYLATLAGLRTLQDGGTAVDAAITVNATLGVVYPHMTGMGGDAFWLVYDAESCEVLALNGSGRAVASASRASYAARGETAIPLRGGRALVTVPGAVDSWCLVHERLGRLPLTAVLEPAIRYARDGYPVSAGQARFTEAVASVLGEHEGTARAFLPGGRVPQPGELLRYPGLATTMDKVAREGRAGFYEGEVRDEIVRAVGEAGGGWEAADLESHTGDWTLPLSRGYRGRTLYQHPPNSQGFAHLMIMGILEHFDVAAMVPDGPEYLHLVVEATKLAFADRDRYLTDPDHGAIPLDRLLSSEYAARLTGHIDLDRAAPTALAPRGQDTTSTVVVDRWRNCASVIQSLYHEFGSGVVAGETGVLLQNRGCAFSLEDDHVNRLEPGKRSFHTLMPGLMLRDGRPELVYGTMGGEGQPQTSTALVTRVVDFGEDVQDAIDDPRWLYGRTWGEETTSLRLEDRFGADVAEELARRGHDVEVMEAWSDLAGHAAAIRIDQHSGVLTGAADPRGEGIAAGW